MTAVWASEVWVSGVWVGVGGWAAAVVLVLMAVAWRLSWMAMRLDRAHSRTERTWAALDAALVRRAHGARQLATDPRLDPTVSLALAATAADALVTDLDPAERERRESRLSEALARCTLAGVALEQRRAVLARRLHNDAVTTAIGLRRRRTVAWFRLAGHAPEPRSFEMADSTHPAPACTRRSPQATKVNPVSGEAHATR